MKSLVLLFQCLGVCLCLLPAGCSNKPAAPVHPHLVRVEGSGAKLRLEKRPAAGTRLDWSGAVDGRGYATGPGTRTSYDKNGRKTQELEATFTGGQPAEGPYVLRQFSRERLVRQTAGLFDASGKMLPSGKAAPANESPEAAYLARQVNDALPLAAVPELDPLALNPPPAARTSAEVVADGAPHPALPAAGAGYPREAAAGLPIPRQKQRPGANGAEDAPGPARQQAALESAELSGIFFSSRSMALAELQRHCLADIAARAEQSGQRISRVPGRAPRWTQEPKVVTRQVRVVNGEPRVQYRATGGKLAADYYLLE